MAQSWGYARVQAGGDTGRCGSGAQRAPSVLLEHWFQAPEPLAVPLHRTGQAGYVLWPPAMPACLDRRVNCEH